MIAEQRFASDHVRAVRDAALQVLGISFASIDNTGGQRRGKRSDQRAMIAYVLRNQANASWNEIAAAVGISSHSSAMTAYQNVKDRPHLLARAVRLADTVRAITATPGPCVELGPCAKPGREPAEPMPRRPSIPISLIEIDMACAEAIAEAVGDCEWRQLPIEERDMYIRAWRAAWAVHRAAMA